MIPRIAGVLFDLGGVLVAVDGAPYLAKMLGVEPEHESLYAAWLASPSVVAHETGRIEATAFAAGYVAELGLPIAPEAFLRDFSNWPTGPLPGALQLLDEIPDRFHVAALSNTSAVHWERIQAMGLPSRFDQVYLSHEIGCLKPAAEAYLVALQGMALSPPEVIFLDDGARNVEAARELGMHAHRAKGPGEARRVLAHYGVVPSA